MSDRALEVHASLPAGGYAVSPGSLDLGEFAARRRGLKPYHECPLCKGFVEGDPDERRVNTLAPLSGRCGTEWCCRRCGFVVAFHGIMS